MRYSVQSLLMAGMVAIILGSPMTAFAQKSKPGGGTTTAAYTIIDLRSPFHAADGNWSQTYAEKISAPQPVTGMSYIVGSYVRASRTHPCLWSVGANQSVVVTDLAGVIEPLDVNAAGIVSGSMNDQPAILVPAVGVVNLPTSFDDIGRAVALNDPDEDGVFQVLGWQLSLPTGRLATLWTVTTEGAVLATRLLENEQTPELDLLDINNSGMMAGVSHRDGVSEPVTAWIDTQDVLQISFLVNPDPNAIRYFRDMQLDDTNNVLGYGAEPAPTLGEYPRAVVWPLDEPVVSLSTLINGGSTSGNGIATVRGSMQVVGDGYANATGRYALLYTNGKITDLNRVSKGSSSWVLGMAAGVNSAGWISGQGRVKVGKTTEDHGYVLVPNAP